MSPHPQQKKMKTHNGVPGRPETILSYLIDNLDSKNAILNDMIRLRK
jgi:hypothetical protein